jgi:hypothetical protein
MNPVNRPDVPPLHAIAGLVLRIVVTAVVLGSGFLVAVYFALGQPDGLFGSGAFPQLISGERNLLAGVPAQDSSLMSILRIAGLALVVVLVVLIGAIGIWDAWQSRHRHDTHSLTEDAGGTDILARGASDAAERGPRETNAVLRWPSERTRMHTRRPERAPTDPDTFQGGTA